MPALDLTTWQAPVRQAPTPAAPSAPPSTSRPARAGAPHTASADKPRGEKPRGSFDQLVDRLADAREADRDANTASPRIAQQPRAQRDDVDAEPRAKDANDGADAPAAPAADPSQPAGTPQTTFPWTLPLNPALWTLETTKGDGTEAADRAATVGADASIDGGAAAGGLTNDISAAAGATIAAPVMGAVFAAPADGAAPAQGSGADVHGSELHGALTQADGGGAEGVFSPDAYAYSFASADVSATTANASAAAGQQASPTKAAGGAATAGDADAAALLDISLAANVVAGAGTAASSQEGTTAALAFDATQTTGGTAEASVVGISGSVSTQGSAQIEAATTAVDQARRQASAELRRALDRAGATAVVTSSMDAQGTQSNGAGVAVLDDAVATDGAVGAGRDGGAQAGVGVSAHAAVTAAHEPRDGAARAASKSETVFDVNAWAASGAGVVPVDEAAAGFTYGDGAHGHGREPYAETFGAAVSPRSSFDGGISGGSNGLPPAFDARSLMGAALDASVDAHASTTSSTIVTTAPPDEQAAQIVRSMRLQWRGAVGEAQLRLQPDHLGQVLVNVRVEQGSVTATLHAETPAAQQWIQTHQQQLRDALDAQGLRVAQLHVTTDPEDRPRREQPRDEARQRGRHQQQSGDADGRRFEIRV